MKFKERGPFKYSKKYPAAKHYTDIYGLILLFTHLSFRWTVPLRWRHFIPSVVGGGGGAELGHPSKEAPETKYFICHDRRFHIIQQLANLSIVLSALVQDISHGCILLPT